MIDQAGQKEHLPGRPHWHCTTCGGHWPCHTFQRRALTITAFIQNGRRALRISMLATQADAESDFAQLGTLAEHGDLHDRFVAWVNAAG